MNLDRMLEDLEATGFGDTGAALTSGALLAQARSAALSTGMREVRVDRLLFATDFLLCQHQGRTMAFTFRAIEKIQLSSVGEFQGEIRKLSFSKWLESLPQQIVLSLTLADKTRMPPATLLGGSKSLVFVESNEPGFFASAIPISSILTAELATVDNKSLLFGF
jgi:hypothetical protein